MTLLRPILVALIACALAGYAVDCAPMASSDEAMQCCGSMPCDPTNQSHDCCKRMVSADASTVLPAQHSDLSVPLAAVVDHFSTPEIPIFAPVPCVRSEAPQHSPPALYTLHSSFLI
jgi:hypothetical protein